MSEQPAVDEVIATHKAKRDDVRRAWKYAVVLMVALVAIAVLSTLLWVSSRDDVDKLAKSNDAGIEQFEYCKTAPKTDPKCQDSVSEPADKLVSGPQGIQGIQGQEGIQGPVGPMGPQGPPGARGEAGLPGNSPRCLLEPSRCVGPSGPGGPAGVQGDKGEKGDQGDPGAKGADGSSPPCLQEESQCQGRDGKDGEEGPQGKTGATGPDSSAEACASIDGTLKQLSVAGDDPTTPEVETMVTILTCVV